MIFADKVIRLRKKNGWSQEELAERMNVSRQSVSKWEGAQTVPDLQKILQLSELFGVTTDYLLKDEIEMEEFTGEDADLSVRRVTLAEANSYLEQRRSSAKKIALATFLCILSPVPLILLGGATMFGVSENLAGGVGMVALFLIVAVAVALYISCGHQNAPFEFLDTDPFEIEYGVNGLVRERKMAYRSSYAFFNTIAAVICVLSPIPLFIGAFLENEWIMVVSLGIMLLMAAVGTAIFINAGVQWASMQRLIKDGEFAPEEKRKNKVIETVSAVYWMVVTAFYLALNFITTSWETSWIIWPVAGVLYAAVVTICRMLVLKNGRDN